ncbi:UDP-N-acetylmuramoyl-tripeptide--D-alanyl-D-alanine ligase [Aliidiomarina celeris]|uniref:UDP-N-acetylmuramoyl-tripeptide--D-alanyl-D- alanine ligase n=1 Tax=Aliidiomarina celeris TaxID=2249428 RepID=UPI000DEAF690|nr:UDP-N-acetylmuramoyl-tripeptide--D-alanyl-D-alanine ligase [Aliidiomarina celeris]
MINVSLQWVCEQINGELTANSTSEPNFENACVGNACIGNACIGNVSIDSRAVQPGDLFICIRGPKFDGHDYVSQAEEAGATAIVTERELTTTLPQIRVANTHQALGALAAAVKRTVAPKTIAITGSSGKTTVKEMVASILRQQGQVLATAGNFNNDIGVPLTLLRLTEEHEFAVIELGANHRGEIAYTTGLTRPDVALINNVAPAHVEGFGDICGVCKAKTEIFKGLDPKGVAVTWADSDFHSFWLKALAGRNHITFSAKPTPPTGNAEDRASVWAENIELNNSGCATFTLRTESLSGKVELTVPGLHNVNNALAAATCCLALAVPLEQIIYGLAAVQPVPGRMWVHQPYAGVRVIDDTYNANVGSAKAALDVLASLPGRRIFVLGDMGELGEQARAYHAEIGAYAITAGIDGLYTIGVLSQSASEVFNGHGGRHFEHQQGVVRALGQAIEDAQQHQHELTILVKGSRSAQMENVVKGLLEQNNNKGSAACSFG